MASGKGESLWVMIFYNICHKHTKKLYTKDSTVWMQRELVAEGRIMTSSSEKVMKRRGRPRHEHIIESEPQ